MAWPRRSSARPSARELEIIDATCPLVAKVHLQVQRFVRQGRAVVLIGHAGHDEVVGTVGKVDAAGPRRREPRRHRTRCRCAARSAVAYVTQTTLSVDDTRELIAALARRYPDLQGPGTRRHLLRDAQPAAGGEADRRRRRPDARGRCRATAPTRTGCRKWRRSAVRRRTWSTMPMRSMPAGCGRAARRRDRRAPRRPSTWWRGSCGACARLGASATVEVGNLRENVTFRLPAAVLRRRPLRAVDPVAAPPAFAGTL